MDELLLDIVQLPPLAIKEKLGQIVKDAVGKAKVKYLVDNEALIPHQSLFHISTSKNNLPELYRRLEEILNGIDPFTISAIGLIGGDNVIAIKLSEPFELREAHEKVVNALYDLRVGEMPWTPSRQPNLLEEEYRKKYGTQYIFKNFKPHISLVKLEDESDIKRVSDSIGEVNFTYQVDTFAVAKVNFWHQVTDILKEYSLNQGKT